RPRPRRSPPFPSTTLFRSAGTDALDVVLRAGVGAVQSTPLITRSGGFIGMFSTHYRSTRHFSERDLRLLDMLARQAADAIERQRSEEHTSELQSLTKLVCR